MFIGENLAEPQASASCSRFTPLIESLSAIKDLKSRYPSSSTPLPHPDKKNAHTSAHVSAKARSLVLHSFIVGMIVNISTRCKIVVCVRYWMNCWSRLFFFMLLLCFCAVTKLWVYLRWTECFISLNIIRRSTAAMNRLPFYFLPDEIYNSNMRMPNSSNCGHQLKKMTQRSWK